MIRTLLKLAVVALVANTTWHLFLIYSPHYKLRDAVQYTSQFRGDMTDEALRDKILSLAVQYELPIGEDEVRVTHDDFQTTVEIAYVQTVEIVPRVTRRWPLSMKVQTLNSRKPTDLLVPPK
jgi:hypothetical protein